VRIFIFGQMRIFLLTLFTFFCFSASAQTEGPGILIAHVVDEKAKGLEGASVQLILLNDSSRRLTTTTDANGAFLFNKVSLGYYKLRISYVGMATLTMDSIHFRTERFDFNLNDIVLKPATEKSMDEIIIYAEKPLVQSKEGNITFNAGESALSAGSNASDLLNNVPLVAKDPNGKVLVRGKEPKILIDDKPVELNQQQLQDLLESLPGSSIEKIEVMTNPPPQYANEQGGVINITTKKGTIGMSGRMSVYAGTRGEVGTNGGFNYRKQNLSFSLNAGLVHNNFDGLGYLRRQNVYSDSLNYLNNDNNYVNKNLRPNARFNLNWDLNKQHAINFTAQYNQNGFDNINNVVYTDINRFDQAYRFTQRNNLVDGESYNPSLAFTYTFKSKKPGEVIRLIGSYNFSSSFNNRRFIEEVLDANLVPRGFDSIAFTNQFTHNFSDGYSLRVSYDVPLIQKKTFLSAGGFYNGNESDVTADASYLLKANPSKIPVDSLSNHFVFQQRISNLRASIKQVLSENFSLTAGASLEETNIHFDLYKTGSEAGNSYWTWLPFATVNKSWKDKLNVTLSYRKTIRRPGIGELNPTIDFSDRYSLRFGNPTLAPSPSHNFDFVVGTNRKSFYANIGLGYNSVEDVFSQVRTLIAGQKTQVTWENISGRKEYEVSTWNGFTVSKRTKLNMSASYTYNRYGSFDKEVRKFRDGGSLTSNVNGSYNIKDLYSANLGVNFNRFANPQGTVRSSVSMNLGLQAKLMQKKLVVTLNVIDPFMQQENRTFTFGNGFTQETYSFTQTRNFRLTLAYNFSKTLNKGRQQILNGQKKKPSSGQ
jgi:outer membrane receptor for ferrienterochelin and colicin